MSNDFVVVIPARYASTRLPGKPLLDIAGQTMIERVYHQAQQSDASRVVVATDDKRIVEAVQAFSGEVCLTRDDHTSGTDRLQEVAQQLDFAASTIVVNVQGDEPLIPPAAINQVAQNLANNSAAGIATLCERIHSRGVFEDPNAVKVVFNEQGMAHYFSRAPIPWPRDAYNGPLVNAVELPEHIKCYRHIGIYAYRVDFLNRFVTWPPAPLEQTESLEQLRALWHGIQIHVAEAVEDVPAGVDTEEDLQTIRQLFDD